MAVAEDPTADFRDLFGYLVRTYHVHLSLPDPRGLKPRQLANKILEQLKEANGQLNKADGQLKVVDGRQIEKQLLTEGEVTKPNANTRPILVNYVVDRLKGRVPGCDKSWFEMRTLADLKQAIAKAAKEAEDQSNSLAKREKTIAFKIPRTRLQTLADLRKDLCGHFVSYRYALESTDANDTPTEIVAREVVSFSPQDDAIAFEMSFKRGANDRGARQQTFGGYAMPLGQSLMCTATHCDLEDPDRDQDYDRGRVIFMRRTLIPYTGRTRFGMMTTTRALGHFEPCATCIILFPVEAPIDNIDEFRQKVTIIRHLDEVMASDFSTLGEQEQQDLRVFLENQPRRSADNRPADKILKLYLDRFERCMPAILERVYNRNEKVPAPFTAQWRETKLLAKDETSG